MKRRESATSVPPGLRYEPLEWLEAGEDKTDPLIVHVRALHRFLKAVLEEFGQTVWLAALKDAGIYGRSWFGPHHWTDGNPCPCRSCTPRRPPPRRRKSSSQVT